MTNLSQLDLNTYLQLSGCKYGELSNSYANDLKWGMKCSKNNLRNLSLLNAYIEILECYNIIGTNKICSITGIGVTLPIDFAGGFPPLQSSISLNIQNILSLSMTSNAFPPFHNTITLQEIANYVNTGVLPTGVSGNRNILVSGITATVSGNSIILFMSYPEGIGYDGNAVSFNIDTPIYSDSISTSLEEIEECTLFTEEDNCFTEKEIQTLINNISKLVNICFMPINFDYEIPEGYTLNADGVLIPTEEL